MSKQNNQEYKFWQWEFLPSYITWATEQTPENINTQNVAQQYQQNWNNNVSQQNTLNSYNQNVNTPTNVNNNLANIYNNVPNINDIRSKYINAMTTYKPWEIADKIRIKTWWVADLDTQIENYKNQLNTSRPILMQKYAKIIDPVKREALIRQWEQNIAKNINELQAIRRYKLWTINDVIKWEIADKESNLKKLELQYKMARDVIWDNQQAEKFKKQMEKYSLDIQKMQLDLKNKEDLYWYQYQNPKTITNTNTNTQEQWQFQPFSWDKFNWINFNTQNLWNWYSIWEWMSNNRPDRNNNPWNIKLAVWQDWHNIPWATWDTSKINLMK